MIRKDARMDSEGVRIRREAGGFMLFRRHTKTREITDCLYVGDVEQLRELATFLNEMADAFDVVEKSLS